MKPIADLKTIQAELESICEHPLFSGSSIYTRLLRYLVAKAIEQEDIKEFSIGTDLFGKDYSVNKNDGSVRIYMYKLRKKLDAYYADPVSQPHLFFVVKKGQYNVHFYSKKEYHLLNRDSYIQIKRRHLMWAGLGTLISLLLFWGGRAFLTRAPEPWRSFLKNGSDNMLVVADKYVLMSTNDYGEQHATLYGTINNDEDLMAFKKENPHRKLEPTDYTLLSKMAPYCTQLLTEKFLDKKQHLNLQLESDLKLDDVKENNIIFIGQRKAMNISSSLFLNNSKVFSRYRDGYKYKKGSIERNYNTQHRSIGKIEYAMVAYRSFSPGKEAIYFVSNHDIGVMATLRNFTDKKWLKTFYKQLPSSDSHFNALFKVSGIHRTDVGCELVALEVLQ